MLRSAWFASRCHASRTRLPVRGLVTPHGLSLHRMTKTNSSALILPAPAPTTTNSIAGTNELRDIKAPVEIPSGWAWLWWTLGALALVAASVAAWRHWRNKRTQIATEKILPPHERARLKLRAAPLLIGDPRAFCILVADTIRLYLEERFDLHAPERTTEEFLYELQSSPVLTAAHKEALGEFLTQCDLVKFARHEPMQTELETLLDFANRLINETEPPPPAAPGAHAELASAGDPQSTIRNPQ